MNITVVGTGYVGIVTAVGLGTLGHNVHCVDISLEKIRIYKNGSCPIYENGLQEQINTLVSQNRLSFDNTFRQEDKVFFITVGTPPLENGDSDLSYLFSALDDIVNFASEGSVIVIKSTVPVGTNKIIVDYLGDHAKKITVASNPEFLREGNALYDFLNPDRIVIGTSNSYSEKMLTEIYEPLVKRGIYFLKTDPNTAELIKHSSNAFLANKIAFINELGDLCEESGANINDLSDGIGSDKRIGREFLKVGPGFGGSCFPKDIRSLNKSFEKFGVKSRILESIISSNDERSITIVKKISRILSGLENKVLCILGLAFKANTDDIRESPSIKIIESLLELGAVIQAYDPKAKVDSSKLIDKITMFDDPTEAINGSNAIIIATEWEEFKSIPYIELSKNKQTNPTIIIDLRNILEIKHMEKSKFKYYCLGMKNKSAA